MNTAVAESLDHLRPWMPWVKFEPLTLAERVTLIEGWTREWEDGSSAIFGIFLDGEIVGGSGLHSRVGAGALEIGYWIHPNHLRVGYATEIARALTTTAFDVAATERVEIRVDEANTASKGVPAKLGYKLERVETRPPEALAETGRLEVWVVTKAAWLQQRPSSEMVR